MKTIRLISFIVIVSTIFLVGCNDDSYEPYRRTVTIIPIQTIVQDPVSLVGASAFAVFAGTAIINKGSTTITGDMGLSPGSSVSGFPFGVLEGKKHINNNKSNQAKIDLAAAYNDAAGHGYFFCRGPHISGDVFCRRG